MSYRNLSNTNLNFSVLTLSMSVRYLGSGSKHSYHKAETQLSHFLEGIALGSFLFDTL